ncbi:MAG: hypothetical protein WAM70_01015 [Pyrinomonadaceae bacterium]
MTEEEIKKLLAENKALQDANVALTSEKSKAEIDKAVAEARRATLMAQLPSTETKALEGKVTTDPSATTTIQQLALRAMSEGIAQMTTAIRTKFPGLTTILIYNERDIGDIAYYTFVTAQLNRLAKQYAAQKIVKDQSRRAGLEMAMPLMAPLAIGAVLKSSIDLISLFRTNVDIQGASVTLEETSLVAEVAKQLQNAARNAKPPQPSAANTTSGASGLSVIYSKLFVPGTLTPNPDDSPVLKALGDLEILRAKAQTLISAFDALDAAAKETDPQAGRIPDLRALNAAFDGLSAAITKSEDADISSALALLLRAEALAKLVQNSETAILFMKAAGGGESRTTQNLWRGGRLYYSGTAILTYILFTNERGVVLSDVISKTTGFKETNLVPS